MTSQMPAVLARLAAGGMVVVADGAGRENEGDLVLPAAAASANALAFMLRHGSGIVCAPMPGDHADRLELPAMVGVNTDPHGTAFTVSVDATATGTGISASDRGDTLRALADTATDPSDLNRPGHVFPLRACDGGVIERQGHTEAATDLVRLAGVGPVAAITELVGDDGIPLHGSAIADFAYEHDLPFLSVDDVIAWRRTHELHHTADARLPLVGHDFSAHSVKVADGIEHVVLALGDVAGASELEAAPLVRIHSECLTGDVFGSQRCDCGDQLAYSLDAITSEGCGLLVYLRGQEGRGIGLAHKLQAYALQDAGADTVDANLQLGLPADAREYDAAAAILGDFGVRRLRLLTNNPAKITALADLGFAATRVAIPSQVTAQNLTYLRTKRDRMGHHLLLPTTAAEPVDRGYAGPATADRSTERARRSLHDTGTTNVPRLSGSSVVPARQGPAASNVGVT